MQTIRLTTAVLTLALGTSAAQAERAWQGSIHLIDVNMLFHFDGYDTPIGVMSVGFAFQGIA